MIGGKQATRRIKARRLILHIGHGKTGSTSIQRCLRASTTALAEAGVLFPDPGRHDNHQLIFPHLHGELPDDPVQMASLASSSGKAFANANKLWSSLRRSIADDTPETVVLSCENQFRPFESKAMARLGRHCEEIADETTVIAYLRDPAPFVLSWIQQETKKRPEFRLPCSTFYRDTLEPFVTQGPGHLIARRFASSDMVEGDAVMDFFSQVLPQVNLSKLELGEREANSTVSAEAMALLQDIFRGSRPLPGSLERDKKSFRKIVVETDTTVPGFARPSLKPEVAALIEARATDLDWVSNTLSVRLQVLRPVPVDPETTRARLRARFEDLRDVSDFCAVDAARKEALFEACVSRALDKTGPLQSLKRRLGL